jgi:hypothetical protein
MVLQALVFYLINFMVRGSSSGFISRSETHEIYNLPGM